MKKLVISVVLLIAIMGVIWVTASSAIDLSASNVPDLPPPPPTPGLPPTDLPHFLPDSTPIKTRDEAITVALTFDKLWTARTEEVNQHNILVEYYATRQEAADKYDLGVFVDRQDALDPTWVVTLSGEVSASSITRIDEMEMVNGVIYLFSATDSNIVAQINGSP